MAYESGEMPLSKWSKNNIINAIKEMVDSDDIFLNEESLKSIETMNLKDLRDLFLKRSSWHHTSKFYNKTNFYEIDVGYIERNYEEAKAFREQEENKIREKEKQKAEKEKQEKTDRIQKWADSHKKEIEKIKSSGYDNIPLTNFEINREIVEQIFNKNYTQDVVDYIMSKTENLSKDLFKYMDRNYNDGKPYYGPHDKNTMPTFSEFLNFDKEKNIGKKRINYDHDKNQYILEEFDGEKWKDEDIVSKIKEVKKKMKL